MTATFSTRPAHPARTVPPADTDLADLATRLSGRLATATDADWDQVRSAWNLAVDQRPDAVALVESPADVQAVIAAAAATGRRVAPQGTGHAAAALGDLTGTILLRTDRLREVTVDPTAKSVRVGAGVLWGEVTAAAAAHGLMALAGSSADVGVVGYTLGGGYSWFARSRGLAVNHVTAVEMVTGDGVFRRVTADSDPDLFWAVRGGGGNLGVVCALEFDLFDVPLVYGGALLFPIDRAREVLEAYAAWTTDLDDTATTCVRLVRVPPLPDVPEPLRGKAFAIVDGAIDLPADEAAALLAPLRALGPVMDNFGPMPSAMLGLIHMDPPQPVPAVGDGMNLTDLSAGVIDALLAAAGPDVEQCALLALDVRHLGGAVGRPVAGGGVVQQLAGGYLVYGVGIAPTPEIGAIVGGAVAGLIGSLQPFAAASDYLNFRERAVEPSTVYGFELARLRRVRAAYDPSGVVRGNQEI